MGKNKIRTSTKVIFYIVGMLAIIPYFNWLMDETSALIWTESIPEGSGFLIVGTIVFLVSIATCIGISMGCLTLLKKTK